MKHAGAIALDQLEPLLAAIRALPGLTEKSRGVFYRGGKAFLHFHEDQAGLFADARLVGTEFERFRVGTEAEREDFLALVSKSLSKSLRSSSRQRGPRLFQSFGSPFRQSSGLREV